ncbi:uncharacterized protein [Palaemon carinicauda]|uniref:uncharacterized protein n=1 Tax=Palaemon carinicauda TaxID=392227 RepID=UPI0035B62B8A
MVFRSHSGADCLIKHLCESFVTFGIPEELISDGGPQLTSGKTQEFQSSWSVHRLTSFANPQANCRAEVAVKTVKRMLTDNTGPAGSLNIDRFQRAMLIYWNSINTETKTSPARVLFSRPIREPIPIPLGRYCPHNTWQETMKNREVALAKHHSRECEKWSLRTTQLPPLKVGDHIYLQNLVSNHPTLWDRTGVVIEVCQFHQYAILVNGSDRVTLRNRQHLRRFQPSQPPRDRIDPVLGTTPTNSFNQPASTTPTLTAVAKGPPEPEAAPTPVEVSYTEPSTPQLPTPGTTATTPMQLPD